MLCCVVGAILIARFVINFREIKRFLGFREKEKADKDGYEYED